MSKSLMSGKLGANINQHVDLVEKNFDRPMLAAISIEEFAELIETLEDGEYNLAHIAEEVCDSLFCIEVLRRIYGLSFNYPDAASERITQLTPDLARAQIAVTAAIRGKLNASDMLEEALECLWFSLSSYVKGMSLRAEILNWTQFKIVRTTARLKEGTYVSSGTQADDENRKIG